MSKAKEKELSEKIENLKNQISDLSAELTKTVLELGILRCDFKIKDRVTHSYYRGDHEIVGFSVNKYDDFQVEIKKVLKSGKLGKDIYKVASFALNNLERIGE